MANQKAGVTVKKVTLTTQGCRPPEAGLETKEFIVVFVGDTGTGKTSFVRRLTHDLFNSQYKPTIDCNYELKIIRYDDIEQTPLKQSLSDISFPQNIEHPDGCPTAESVEYKIKCWDLSGKKINSILLEDYLLNADGAFILADPKNPSSVLGSENWNAKLDEYTRKGIPRILVYSKMDLVAEGELTAIPDNFDEYDDTILLSCKDESVCSTAFDAMIVLLDLMIKNSKSKTECVDSTRCNKCSIPERYLTEIKLMKQKAVLALNETMKEDEKYTRERNECATSSGGQYLEKQQTDLSIQNENEALKSEVLFLREQVDNIRLSSTCCVERLNKIIDKMIGGTK
jgi:Ras and EF-hand domain-containing protein